MTQKSMKVSKHTVVMEVSSLMCVHIHGLLIAKDLYDMKCIKKKERVRHLPATARRHRRRLKMQKRDE